MTTDMYQDFPQFESDAEMREWFDTVDLSELSLDRADGKHVCPCCGAFTTYQKLSGGREFYCPDCGMRGLYPEGEGGPRARLLTKPGGYEALKEMMLEEIERRKNEKA